MPTIKPCGPQAVSPRARRRAMELRAGRAANPIGPEDEEWDHLTERQKDFYRLCIREVIRDELLIERARGSDKAVPVTTV